MQATSEEIPVGPGDAVSGQPDALVTLVMFTDLECPYCALVNETLLALRRDYDGASLRLVVKHNPLPFHAHADRAARMAQAVLELGGPDRFFAYLELVYASQEDLSARSLLRFGEKVGVSAQLLEKRAAAPEVREKVARDMALAEKLGASGTPNSRVNGVEIGGAQPVGTFRTVIERELEAGRALAEQGVPRMEVYASRVRANAGASTSSEEEEPQDLRVRLVPVGDSPVLGPAEAPVTIVTFSDFQCPYCVRAHRTLTELMARYPGKIRLAFKHSPLDFHDRALPAAQLAVEVRRQKGDKAFWTAVERLWALEAELGEERLLAVARELGVDEARARRALSSSHPDPAILADQELAADLDVSGTPQFFINGRRLSGARGLEEFAALVEAGLAQAEQMRARGVAPAAVYAELMKTAVGPDLPDRKELGSAPGASPGRGPRDAPVEVQVFTDFQCPYCRRLLTTIEALERKYPGQLRVVHRNLPLTFHARARDAATAALEALAQGGEDAFWRMHAALFAHQDEPGGLERRALAGLAAELGLDVARFREALEQQRHEATIMADEAAASAAGISGVPAVLVNGYFIEGAQPFAHFDRVVRLALREAKPARR